jgi:hypothetical protein
VRAAKKALEQNGLRELSAPTRRASSRKQSDGSVEEEYAPPQSRSRSRSRSAKRPASPRTASPRSASKKAAAKEHSQHEEKETIEFGGPVGTVIIMLLSHCTLYYLWISWKYYDAALLYPRGLTEVLPWLRTMLGHVVTGAAPNVRAATVYWTFLFVQGFMAWVIPGLKMRGLPIRHLNNIRLEYNCNGIFTWYLSLAIMAGLHFSGTWRLSSIFENFGPLMTVAILTTDAIALLLYVTAFASRTAHRLSGNRVYDFFMGASLNPRLGSLDLKVSIFQSFVVCIFQQRTSKDAV